MVIGRNTVCSKFEIRSVRWKGRCIGLAKHRIGTHNEIEILQEGKDGKRYFPDVYYISKQKIDEGIAEGEYVVENRRGVWLIIVPINDLEVLERA